jgi:hypothetical protein
VCDVLDHRVDRRQLSSRECTTHYLLSTLRPCGYSSGERMSPCGRNGSPTIKHQTSNIACWLGITPHTPFNTVKTSHTVIFAGWV